MFTCHFDKNNNKVKSVVDRLEKSKSNIDAALEDVASLSCLDESVRRNLVNARNKIDQELKIWK